jgi:hypothetical protein
MNAFSRQAVVDQLTTQLAERRRTARGRRAAYLALAQAILDDQRDLTSVEPHGLQPDRSPVAA